MTRQADIIKIAAVVTAMPRWIGALLAAEGIAIPEEWLVVWIPLSALFAAAMAVVEGWAFAYVFNAWRNQKDRRATRLLWLAVISAAVFIVVLAPYVAAQVRGVPLVTVVGSGPVLWAWSAAVAASTIAIVASVGYAQRETRNVASDRKSKPEPTPERVAARCTVAGCEWSGDYTTAIGARNALNAHVGHAHREHSENGREPIATARRNKPVTE